MIKLLLFVIKVFSQCGIIQQAQDPSSVDVQAVLVFSIGVWTKFQSLNIYVEQYHTSWIVLSMVTNSHDPILQLIVEYDEVSFKHYWIYALQDGSKSQQQFVITFESEFGLYEGQWFLNHLSVDLFSQELMFYLWPFGKDFKYIQNIKIQDSLQLSDFLYQASLGTDFQGYVSRIIQNVYFSNNEDLITFVKDCTIPECISKRHIIKDQLNFEENKQDRFDIVFPIDIKYNYSIGQWFRINLTQIPNIDQIFLFGVTSSQMFLYDDFYQNNGDYSVFKVFLNYNIFLPESNSFLINTYSYITPIQGQQRKRFILKMPIQNIDYLKNWIYMEYQHFQQTSQVLLYFSQGKHQLITKFNQVINHFSDIKGYVVYKIPNDDTPSQLFIGQILQLNNQDCFINQQSIVCSLSCGQCFGPLNSQCLSCNPFEETFRLFNPSTQTCECIDGYIDTFEKQCKSFYQIFRGNIIFEEQRQEQQCQPGQFRGNNNKCFSCPIQYSETQNLLCGNCFEDTQLIKSTLLCTYDFIYDEENQSFQNVTRRVQDYEFYLLNLEDGGYVYYQGVIGFCNQIILPNCYYSYQQTFLAENKLISCLPNYISDQSMGYCKKCDENCLVCNRDTNICDKCNNYHTVFKQRCVKCPENCTDCQSHNEQSIICNKCDEGYSNFGDNCQKCGSGCQICYSDFISSYDSFNYYISSDAVNCFKNDISNCQIEYVYDELTKQSSFDVHLNKINNEWIKPKCALCQPGYINTLDTCILDQSLLSTDQVIQTNQKTYKIMKSYDKDQLIKTDCKLDMCELCIFPYDLQFDQSRFCIQCQIGYYSHQIYGTCQSCPSQCYKCVHQHKIYKDAWKWQIKAFNYFILNNQNFNRSPYDTEISYEEICTECINGLELYEGNCIKPCDPSCEKCIKENGISKCVKCRNSIFGQQSSIQDNKCIQCLHTCKLCIKTQTVSQQLDYQYYFNQHCLIPQNIPNLTYNSYNYKICQQNTPCQKILNITLNVYCKIEMFQNDLDGSLDKQNFSIYNIMMSHLFVYTGYSNFGEIEKDYLIQYYNQIQLDKAYYYLNIIPDQYGKCSIEHSTTLISKLRNTVSGLQQLHITFFSKDQIIIESFSGIKFKSFSSLEFIRVGFQAMMTQIYFEQIDILNIRNCIFLMEFQYHFIQFVGLDLQYVEFENVIFNKFSFNYFYGISSIFQLNNPQIVIQNLTTIDAIFINSKIFQINGIDGGSLKLSNFYLKGSLLQGSNLIQLNSLNVNFIIEFENGNFLLNLDNSSIFSCPQLKTVSMTNINFSNIKSQTSYFYSSLEIQLRQIKFVNIQLFSSFIYKSEQLGGSHFLFYDISFNNCSYDNQSYIMNILQNNGTLQITKLLIRNLSIMSYIIGINSLFNIQISNVLISYVNIEKTSGINDFKIINTNFVKIFQVNFTQNEQFRVLGLQSLDCFLTNLQSKTYSTGLNIRNFTNVDMYELNVKGIQTINNPFISIQQGIKFDENVFTELNIKNCQFSNNQIILTNINILTSLIIIQSNQQGSIFLNNITVQQNLMIDFIQDKFYDSALFIVVDALYQYVNITMMLMSQNHLVNSSQSVMRIKAYLVFVDNCKFSEQNLYNYQVLKQWLYYGFDFIYHETIQILYPTISQGGASFIYAREIVVDNSIFFKNRALNGGSLYLISLNSIKIINSQFIDSKAQINTIQQYQLSEFASSGGALYIVSESQNLSLLIHNCTFIDCSASKQGGSIYIDLTTSDVSLIQLQNLTIIDSISLQGSFIKLSSQQKKQNSVNITQIAIRNSFQNLQNFLGSLYISSESYIEMFLYQNQLINIEFSSLNIEQLFITEMYFVGFLNLQNNYHISLTSVQIINVHIFNQTLIDISQSQLIQQNSYFNQLQILDLQQSQPINLDCVNYNDILTFKAENMKCVNNLSPKDLQHFVNDEKMLNILHCNLNKLSQFQNNQFLILYNKNMQTHKLYFEGLLFKNINIPYLSGLYMIKSISTQSNQNQILFQNFHIINSQCGQQGCSNLVGADTTRFLQHQNIYQSLLQLPQTVKILDSQFINNTAYQGTLNINSVDILINNSIISNNIIQTQGGGIYYQGDKKLYVYFTKISQNTAQKGGAIYLENYHQSQQISSELEIDSNVALQFSNGIAEFPKSITIIMNNIKFKTQVIDKTEFNYYEEIIVPNYKPPGLQNQDNFIYLPTGQQLQNYQYFDEQSQQYLKYNLSLRIVALNSQNQIIQNLNGTYFKFMTNSYNLDDLIIYFNPYQQEYLIMEISCSSIKTPKYSNQPPYSLTGFYNNYKLFLKVKTFECQRGEFYNQTEFSCKQCDASQQFYTVIPGGKCQIKNDINTKSLTSARLELRDGYWRPTETNDRISECYHLKSNCLGGWEPGDKSCFMGHIGALCEQCDIYNTKGDGKYSISNEYQCGNCNQTNQNGLIIFFISLWTLMSILITVKGTVETVQWTTQQIKLKKIGLRMEIYKENNSSILVKLFINYLLILASISTFQLNLPNLFGEIITNIGNPVQAMSYSLDCFLVDLTSIQIIYFRVIWAIIMPLIYSSAFLTSYILVIKLKKAYYSFSVISTSLIYIYAYMQPNLIGAFISLLSYRNISNILWIQGNVAYLYLTQTHYKWIYGFLSPALTIFGFLIPLLLFIVLNKNKHNLNNPKFRMVWGYMYNEYLDNAYFWEIVKICQREIIIIFLIFYQDQVVLKSALVFLQVIFYDILAKYYLPYKTRKMNHLDSNASLICASSIVSGQIIFAATQSGDLEITWPFYLFLVIINALFILKMLFLIFQAYMNRFNNLVEQVKERLNLKFPSLKYQHPRLKILLEPEINKAERIKKMTLKIRKSLMPHAKQISLFKKYNTQNISESKIQSDRKFYILQTQQVSPKSSDAVLLIQNDLYTKNQEDEIILQNEIIDEVGNQEPQFHRDRNQDSSNYVRQSAD